MRHIYHAFHHNWIAFLSVALNEGRLPANYYTLPEQDTGGYGADVVSLRGRSGTASEPGTATSATATIKCAAPQTRLVSVANANRVRKRKSHVAIKHVSGDETIAIIELVSAAHQDNRNGFVMFVQKACDLIERGVHLLVIDLFPPTNRDSERIHSAIWGELAHGEFLPPADKPLTLVNYDADFPPNAYVEPVAVGDTLPDMPMFLAPRQHVLEPLETTH